MGNVNWSDENSMGEVLSGLLANVSDSYYAYTDDVESNPLELALFNMTNRISTKRPNLISIITLDHYGITGDKLVKLWEMCNEDAEYFEKTLSYVTGTSLSKCFTRDEVVNNMDLDEPILFIPDDDVVPFFGELAVNSGKVDIEKVDEIIYALRTTLVKKYNELVQRDELDMPILPLPKKEEKEKLDGNIEVNASRLYFGKVMRDLTGGVLGISMETWGLFESSPNVMKIGGRLYYTLRDLEDGSFVMVDENGKKLDWNTPIEVNGEATLPADLALTTMLPSKEIINLSVGPLKNIVKDAIEQGIENEALKRYREMLRGGATVSKCNDLLKDLAKVYEILYGGIGKNKGM